MKILSVEYPEILTRVPSSATFASPAPREGRAGSVEAQAARLYEMCHDLNRQPVPWPSSIFEIIWRVRRGPTTVYMYRFLDAVRAARVAGMRARRVGCFFGVFDAEDVPVNAEDYSTREDAELAITRMWARAIA